MKNPAFRPVHKRKQRTTNAAPDTHMEFCKRCYARNLAAFCPRTKAGFINTKACAL